VLSLRAKESKLVVVDGFALGGIKTAKVSKALKALGAKSALLVDGANDDLEKSARNHTSGKYLSVSGLNVDDVLDHETLVLSKAVLADLEKRLKPSVASAERNKKKAGGAA
jgi:large subunit ribosomal protein L4